MRVDIDALNYGPDCCRETIKQLFPNVQELPITEGWYLFIPENKSAWIVGFTFLLARHNKGKLCVVEDGDYIPFKYWCKGEWFGPISSELLEVLND